MAVTWHGHVTRLSVSVSSRSFLHSNSIVKQLSVLPHISTPTLNKPNQNAFHHHQPPCRPYRRYLQHHTVPYCPRRMARECDYRDINHIKCSQHRLSRDSGTLGGYLGRSGGCYPRNSCLAHLVHRLSHHQSQSEGSERSARPTSSSGDVVGGIESFWTALDTLPGNWLCMLRLQVIAGRGNGAIPGMQSTTDVEARKENIAAEVMLIDEGAFLQSEYTVVMWISSGPSRDQGGVPSNEPLDCHPERLFAQSCSLNRSPEHIFSRRELDMESGRSFQGSVLSCFL